MSESPATAKDVYPSFGIITFTTFATTFVASVAMLFISRMPGELSLLHGDSLRGFVLVMAFFPWFSGLMLVLRIRRHVKKDNSNEQFLRGIAMNIQMLVMAAYGLLMVFSIYAQSLIKH